MTLVYRAVNTTIRSLTRILCRIDGESLQRIPNNGPLIVVSNHINFIEVPLVYTHLQPRPVTGFAKSETWENPFLAPLFDLWGAIPLQRGEADLVAMREGLAALEKGNILGITPEGTRSGDGRLRRGHPGVVTMALRSNAPLIPMVVFGGEMIYHNMRRLQRTDFHIRVGELFRIDTKGESVTRALRQQIIDEIMYQLAVLLPVAYRGVYTDVDAATEEYLRFE